MNSQRLPLIFCLIADFPPDSNIDCSTPSKSSKDDDGGDMESDYYNGTVYCFECPSPGIFLLGGGTLSSHGSSGHIVCISLWILTVIIGVFGIFSNIFIISVLRRRSKQRTFDFLLITLASFDLLTSFAVLFSTTATVTLFEGWNLGPTTVVLYFVPTFLSIFGRSGSAFMTVLITVERYLVIAQPTKFSTWFSPRRVKAYAVGVGVIALLLNIPRFSSVKLEYNTHGQSAPSLRGMTWIVLPTTLEKFWYQTLKAVHYQIDIWLPFPLLLVFNTLLFVEITKFSKKRQELNSKQRKDIRAARMFLPVVILLFFCNIEPIIHYIFLHFKQIYYRELALGFDLSMAMNAAVNLPIYYSRGSSFREEIRAALPNWIKFIMGSRNNHPQDGAGNGELGGRMGVENNGQNNSGAMNTTTNACL